MQIQACLAGFVCNLKGKHVCVIPFQIVEFCNAIAYTEMHKKDVQLGG